MHRFKQIDAQILLGLAAMEEGYASSCAGLLASCTAISSQIPTADELAAAFNKLLYISAIVLESESVALAPFGREMIAKVRAKTEGNVSPNELPKLLYQELSAYKLKSMCNRNVWSPEQYQQAIAAYL